MQHQTKKKRLHAKTKGSHQRKLHSTLITKSLSHWKSTLFSKQSGSTVNLFILDLVWMRSGKMDCNRTTNHYGRCWL